MASSSTSKKLATTTLTILIALLIFGFIYWLWQRQPKDTDILSENPSPAQQNQIVDTQEENIAISTNPSDGQVLDTTTQAFNIKTTPNAFVVILSNTDQQVAKTDATGTTTQQLKLDEGLNLIQISVFNKDFSKKVDKQIAVFAKGLKTTTSAKALLAGPVKNIFQNVLTLSTLSGDKNVSQDKSTKTTYPSPLPATKTSKTDQSIRVGDYLLALGNLQNNQFQAQTITVYRDNKPQITKNVQILKITSTVKNNLFSAISGQDKKILQLTLAKDSTIFKNGQAATNDDIKKDTRAIIVYHSDDDQNSAILVYLLP